MGKDMWDALEANFGVLKAGNELYDMKQYYDYKMIDELSVWSKLMKYSPFLRTLRRLPIFYRTNLLPEASLPSFLLHGGIYLLL
jgi:hypothetical protein